MKIKTVSNMKYARQFFCLLMIFFPIIITAQENNKGIKWITGLSWEQVKEKAKREGKYVFVDCYATWCGPCKVMDRTVYPQDAVGNYINSRFVSIKVQYDTSINDNKATKKWYSDAARITKENDVNAFPTFLFFSPDGKLVHRAAGGYKVEDFLSIAANAVNPQTQYYTLVDNFHRGKLDFSYMHQLAISASLTGDKILSGKVATAYLKNLTPNDLSKKKEKDFVLRFKDDDIAKTVAQCYIKNLQVNDLDQSDNIEFIERFTNSSKEHGFMLFYEHQEKINTIMQSACYSDQLLDAIISKEEIFPFLIELKKSHDKEPNWNVIYNAVSKKYTYKIADRNIATAKMSWFSYKKNWKELTKTVVYYINNYRNNTNNFSINNLSYSVIFQHSNDTSALIAASNWMRDVIKDDKYLIAEQLDTYANLLYKLGRVKEALEWQNKAVNLNPDIKENVENLEKMKKGIPTWPETKE